LKSKRAPVGSIHGRAPGHSQERSTIRFLGEPDAFADVLSHLRVGPVAYCRSELTAPWGLDLPFEDGMQFHSPAEGGCWLVLNGQEVWLDCGDIALVVSGSAHRLLDAPTSPASPVAAYRREIVEPNLYRMTGGGGGAATVLVCCRVEVQEGQHILGMLPTPLVVHAQEPVGAGIQETLRLMAREASSAGKGRAAVINRLAEVVIAHLMRAWMEMDGSDGWTPALRDPQIGPVIAAVHRAPGRAWTVETLAGIARLSRSTFSARFTDRVGVSPSRYIAQLRMRLAVRRLKSDKSSLAQIAADLGYQSEGAFARAFKRVCGKPPGAVRRAASGVQLS
jgi:AraC-like DNA-binding protein